jgi:hypothetical protein
MTLEAIKEAIAELPEEDKAGLAVWLKEQVVESAYRDMAADADRECEALAWSEGMIADAAGDEPGAAR